MSTQSSTKVARVEDAVFELGCPRGTPYD